jgi:hypothetical protein
MSALASRRMLRPPGSDGAWARLVRLAPDGRLLAWASEGGVYLGDPETGWSRRIAAYAGAPIEALDFSPDGAFLAWIVGSKLPLASERFLAWSRTTGPGEVGRTAATAFAWSPSKAAVFLTDVRDKGLFRLDLEAEARRKIADYTDRGDAEFPPSIAVSADGKRIAVTRTDARDDVIELHVLARGAEAETEDRLLTQIPGARAHVRPFWSPKGVTLGIAIVHLEQAQSAILAMVRLEGDGEILHARERVNAPVTPAWSPSGRSIAFFAAERPGRRSAAQRLALLDVAERRGPFLPRPLHDPAGTPLLWAGLTRDFSLAFRGDATLVLDGGPAAEIFSFEPS